MWTDEREAAVQFGAANPGQRDPEGFCDFVGARTAPIRAPTHGRNVVIIRLNAQNAQLHDHVGTMLGARDARVRHFHLWSQSLDEFLPPLDDLGAECNESLIPQLERRQLPLRNAGTPRALQKRVPLLEHSLVVGDDPREPRRQLHE